MIIINSLASGIKSFVNEFSFFFPPQQKQNDDPLLCLPRFVILRRFVGADPLL